MKVSPINKYVTSDSHRNSVTDDLFSSRLLSNDGWHVYHRSFSPVSIVIVSHTQLNKRRRSLLRSNSIPSCTSIATCWSIRISFYTNGISHGHSMPNCTISKIHWTGHCRSVALALQMRLAFVAIWSIPATTNRSPWQMPFALSTNIRRAADWIQRYQRGLCDVFPQYGQWILLGLL